MQNTDKLFKPRWRKVVYEIYPKAEDFPILAVRSSSAKCLCSIVKDLAQLDFEISDYSWMPVSEFLTFLPIED